jgi:meiotically up-regulated gene 157 (Mug157) protein
VTDLGGNEIMIYGLPQIFVDYPWDIQMVINELVAIDDSDVRRILHHCFAAKACTLSIKA